jgi:riboflavin kinase/FMN adenylyltransferase
MQQFSALQDSQLKAAWLTIGAFDGVHVGHQTILREITAGAHAKGSPAVVLSFDPHPIEVLRGPLESFYLSSLQEKTKWIADLGVDALITQPFDRLVAQTSARDFVLKLKKHLDLNQLWVGEDFALGHNREGDLPTLRSFGDELGFDVKIVAAVEMDGDIVSSSRIRKLVAEGEVEAAKALLGRPYTLTGKVVRGEGRGASIGIPTANLEIWPKRAVPAEGVYAGWAEVQGKRWAAVTNIGVRPTFEDKLLAPVVESHLLDYDGGEFYGEDFGLDFVTRLRAEKRFSGVDELLAQIKKDIQRARELLAD